MNNFKKIGLILVLFAAIPLSAQGQHDTYRNAETRVINFDGNVTASQVSTTVDVNNDGFTGNLTTGIGRSNYGRIVGRSVSEVSPLFLDPQDPTSFQTCAMPNGDPGLAFELEAFNGVLRIEKFNGAVLLQKNNGTACFELVSCIDMSTGALMDGCEFVGDWKLDITGGLGGMDGASGQLTLEGAGVTMLADPSGNFAGFTGHFFGQITIPKKRNSRR